MATTKDIGKMGEDVAAEYLSDLGYDIVERNYNVRMGEIDIIAVSPEDVLVFVEVKTRSGECFGLACEAVDRRKQEKIIKAAQTYTYYGDMRFDIIEVYYEKGGEFLVKRINHIENAFQVF